MKKFLLMFSIIIGVLLSLSVFSMAVPDVSAQQVERMPTGGTWVVDPEVTFTGKNAARSKDLLNWTLHDYRWTFTAQGQTSPLESFWLIIRNIIYALFILFVIATAFILIATR